MKTIDFNLNGNFFVKLREQGFIHWMEKDNKYLPLHLQDDLQCYKGKADPEGYVRFQAWEFIKMFGETLRTGNQQQLFDLNIKIEVV